MVARDKDKHDIAAGRAPGAGDDELISPIVDNSSEAEGDPSARIVELERALAEANGKVAELKDQLLRALAETENVRRRVQRDRDDAVKYAASGLAKELLPVADNLRRALAAIPREALEADEALRTLATGVEMTERLLLAAFERHQIKRIDAQGQKFDSNLHQAMFEVPGSGLPAGMVAQVLEDGYTIYDRLLRPALVGVAKAEPAAGGGNGAAPTTNGSGEPQA